MTPISVRQAQLAITNGYLARVPVLLTGGPRIGKTTATELAARQIAEQKGLEFVNYHTDEVPFVDEQDREKWWAARDPESTFGYRRIPVPLWDLGLTMGIPMPQEGSSSMRFLRPNFIPDKGQGLLCLDELTQADKATQKGFLGLLWERQAGDHRMADGWGLVATGNRLTDRAGVEQLISPIRGRLQILEVEPELEDWLKWHQKSGGNPIVRAYLKWRGATGLQLEAPKVDGEGKVAAKKKAINCFYGFDAGASEQSFPSPGSWDMVGRCLSVAGGIADELLGPSLSGMLGSGVAADFIAFVRTYKDLPSIEDVRRDPTGTKVPNALSAQYAMMLHLATKGQVPQDIKPMVQYCKDRVPLELQAVLMNEIQAALPENAGRLGQSREFGQWVVENAQVLGVQ